MVYRDDSHQLTPSDHTPDTAEREKDAADPQASPPRAHRQTSYPRARVTPLVWGPADPFSTNVSPARPLRYGWSPNLSPEPSASLAPCGAEGGGITPEAPNGITILIVENEESNRMLMEEILGFAGYHCVVACNGLEALDVFERERPDIILTDVSMPVMDGYEATAAIRARPHGTRVPIVAVTAHAMSGERERALQQGCTDYLAKPYRTHELLEVVERMLNRGVIQGGGSSSCGGGF